VAIHVIDGGIIIRRANLNRLRYPNIAPTLTRPNVRPAGSGFCVVAIIQRMDTKSESRAKKKAQFSEGSHGKRKTTAILVATVLVLAAVGIYLVLNASSDNPTSTAVATSPDSGGAETRDVKIALSDVSGTAKFFDYKLSDNRPVRFFVIKSSDGVYRAALDACDTCYHAKKGYHQEGDDMICNNCGLHFHSSQINEVHGGCNPVGLPRTIDGNQLVIKASELESRGGYF
jgi:uncharacterized membrane protein